MVPLRRLVEVRRNWDLPPLLSERGGAPFNLQPGRRAGVKTLPSSVVAEATSGVRPLSMWSGRQHLAEACQALARSNGFMFSMLAGQEACQAPIPLGRVRRFKMLILVLDLQ